MIKIKSSIIFLIFFLFFFEISFSKTFHLKTGYLGFSRPMPILPMVSGSFGEFRPSHLHTGIDYRTFLVNNIPILATREAYVYRLYGSQGGYGKALYLKHSNHYTSVMGHLNYLTDSYQLEAGWQMMKLMSDRRWFSVYLPRNRFRFSRTEVVAYSGERGSGPSHLHYELWNEHNERLNFISPKYSGISDTQSPIVQNVYVFTKDYKVTRKKTREQYCKVKLKSEYNIKSSYKQYVCKKILDVDGLAGLKISSFDNTNNSGNKLGLYSIELKIDDQRIYYIIFNKMLGKDFRTTYDIYDRGKTRLFPSVRYTYRAYWPVSDIQKENKVTQNVYYHKLYGYIQSSTWKKNSRHKAVIRVKDANENSSDTIVFLRKVTGEKYKTDVSSVRPRNNLLKYRKYTKYLNNLKLFTNKLTSKAFLKIEKYNYKRIKLGRFIRRYSRGRKITWYRRAYRNKLYFHWKTNYQAGKGVFNIYGKLVSTRYDRKKRAYVGSITQSTILFLGRDFYAPSYKQSFLLGSLDQEMFYLRVNDKGAGLDRFKFDVYLDGVKLNSRQKTIFGVRYDRDRKAFLFPTGFRSSKEKFQKGSIHLLWFRAYDKTNNSGHLWRGYINLNI